MTLLLTALGAQASVVDATASYVYSSHFNQARAGASVPIGTTASVGLEAKYVEDKFDGGFHDPVYSVYMPIWVDLEIAKVSLLPFYYFKNHTHQDGLQDPFAFGVAGQLVMDLVNDEVQELYTQAYIGVGYARQKGTLFKDNDFKNRYYDETAFTLGLRQNFYGAYVFHFAGTIYQYPDGISRVESFRGIFDQNDFAFTQSYDVSRELGKYALSARFSRVWAEHRSSLYFGYHYAEFYTADPQHSILVGNTFYLAKQVNMDAAYNHILTVHNENRRDLFYVRLNVAF